MIQRIQSLWLLLAAVALIAVCFFPVGKFIMPQGLYECSAFKIIQTGELPLLNLPVWIFGLLAGFAGFFSFLAIFHFKKRSRQIRLTGIALVFKTVLAVSMVCMFLYIKYLMQPEIVYGASAWLPFIGIIFDLLAINGIRKDDALVKSLDRIR
ncbi:MAG TPA: DUF4293 domain-containing protein [Bacteroidales bacterium]|nr:DUF4293 domain-containing protein [Bacteroidales bacterium]